MDCPPSCPDDLCRSRRLDDEVAELFRLAALADPVEAVQILRRAERRAVESRRRRRRSDYDVNLLFVDAMTNGY